MKKLLYIILTAAAICGFSSEIRAQWTVDTKLSVTDTNAALSENADICLVASGDSVHVVWYDNKKDSGAIYYRHSYDGGITWAAPMRLTPFSKSVDFPSVALSGSFVHVGWRDNSDSGSYYIHSTDGGNTWGSPVLLGTYYFWPSVAASGSNAYMTFNSSIAGNSEVYFRRSTDNGATWNPVFQISNPPGRVQGRSEDQSISASSNNIDMVWNDNRTGIMQAFYRRSRDNGVTWGPEIQLSNALKFSYFPMVRASGQFVDVVRGDRDAGNNFQIMYTHSNDSGTTWSTEVNLSNSSSSNAYPVIMRDGQNVHVVWWSFGGGIFYRRSTDGGVTWDSTTSLLNVSSRSTGSFIELSGPVLHLIWLDSREGHNEVYYKRNPTGNPVAPSANFVAPNTIDFGNLKIALTRDSAITLHNLGKVKLNILKYSLFDPANGFILIDTIAHSIAAGDSVQIKARFAPSQVQSYSAILTIVTDESASSSHQIMLTGKGVSGQFASVSEVDFGDVKVGGTKDTTVILQNTGVVAMNITGYFLTDPNNGFMLTDTTHHYIAAQSSATISIRFNAAIEQSYAATLTITTDESGQATHRINLSGRGINSKLSANPTTLDFGKVDSGKSVQKTFTIANTGTAPVTIDSLIPTGSNEFSIDSSAGMPTILSPDGKTDVKISFHAQRPGAASALITINASEGSPLQVLLTGISIGKKDTVQQSSVRMISSAIQYLQVTPNPASNNAVLKFSSAKNLEDVKLYFYNPAGQLLHSQSVGALEAGMQSISLLLPRISGIAFLRIVAGGELIGTAEMVIVH
jgi:hypothetical protein